MRVTIFLRNKTFKNNYILNYFVKILNAKIPLFTIFYVISWEKGKLYINTKKNFGLRENDEIVIKIQYMDFKFSPMNKILKE